MTKLRAALPKDPEDNGLPTINKALNEDPHTTYLIIARIECFKTEINHDDSDAANAVARIVQVEPMVDPDDEKAVAEVLTRAKEERIGRVPLPTEPPEE